MGSSRGRWLSLKSVEAEDIEENAERIWQWVQNWVKDHTTKMQDGLTITSQHANPSVNKSRCESKSMIGVTVLHNTIRAPTCRRQAMLSAFPAPSLGEKYGSKDINISQKMFQDTYRQLGPTDLLCLLHLSIRLAIRKLEDCIPACGWSVRQACYEQKSVHVPNTGGPRAGTIFP